MQEQYKLRIKAEKLGTIKEIRKLLKDFDNVYSSIYAFNFLVDVLEHENIRKIEQNNKKIDDFKLFWKEFHLDRYFYNDYFFERFWNINSKEAKPNLRKLQKNLDLDKIILPSDILAINKVNIQSPGFWEFLGALNPLQQIREYLNDRHERKKDKKYRSRQEEILGNLKIAKEEGDLLTQRIKTLRDLGFSESEIREMVINMVIKPLNKLGEHQDNGLIENEDTEN